MTFLYVRANCAYCFLMYLIISVLCSHDSSTIFVRKFVVRTKRLFVQKSTICTKSYKNRALFNLLIYNVINTEK